jgi:hypothetical protein
MDTYKIQKALAHYFPWETADRLANALVSMKDTAQIVVDGVHLPTGKTTLTNMLNKLDIKAVERWEKKSAKGSDNYIEIVITLNKPLEGFRRRKR